MRPCDIDGCSGTACWQFGLGNRRKHVCRKCRDELIAVYGWEFKRSLYDPAVA
jgi:hypothetical protein